MPNIQSAKKRVHQSAKRTARNRVRKERLKKSTKVFAAALVADDKSKIDEELRKISKALDKAGNKGLFHKNKVRRRKSQVARAANKAKSV